MLSEPPSSRVRAIALLCAALLVPSLLSAAPPFPPDTEASSAAQVHPVGLDESVWTHGFWAERLELCRSRLMPGLWLILAGTNHTHFYQNFRLAAGLAAGRHRGAPFNDGDFYKWLEAASALLATTRDPQSERRLEEIISVIAQAQRADGYLFTPVLIAQRSPPPSSLPAPGPFQDPLQFEMYNFGHLFTAACVHHRVTGQTNFLAVACKAADFLDRTFREPKPELARHAICPSHYMGLVELYRTTHNPRYLELAKRLLAMRTLVTDGTDDNQDRIPFAQHTNAMGHAVRANYLYAGVTDLFLETGDRALFAPLEPIWRNVVQQKLYITGGCGALYDGASPDGAKDQRHIARVHQAYGRNYQLPNLTAHNETCASIASVLWNWRLFLATGEARFIDLAELTLFNSVLSGVSLDGTNFFYVNPLRSTQPLSSELRWRHQRVPYLNSFCCPPNLARTLAELSGYAYGTSSNAVWVNLYGSSRLTTTLPSGQTVKLTQETDYPWNGRIRITLLACPETWTLKLRIPGWAEISSLRVNGALAGQPLSPSTYAKLRGPWHPGDSVDLDLRMPVQLIEANPLVEETLNQVALRRGPLIYCLESPDLPRSLRLHDIAIPPDMDLVARYDQSLLDGVAVLEGTALARAVPPWNGQLYREVQPTAAKPVRLRFIPYFAWANRGPSEMSVWLPLAPASAPSGTPRIKANE